MSPARRPVTIRHLAGEATCRAQHRVRQPSRLTSFDFPRKSTHDSLVFRLANFCWLTTNQWVKRLAFDWSRHHDLLPPREMPTVARRISRLCFPALVSPRRSGTGELRLRCAIRRSLRRQCASEGRNRCPGSIVRAPHGSWFAIKSSGTSPARSDEQSAL